MPVNIYLKSLHDSSKSHSYRRTTLYFRLREANPPWNQIRCTHNKILLCHLQLLFLFSVVKSLGFCVLLPLVDRSSFHCKKTPHLTVPQDSDTSFFQSVFSSSSDRTAVTLGSVPVPSLCNCLKTALHTFFKG